MVASVHPDRDSRPLDDAEARGRLPVDEASTRRGWGWIIQAITGFLLLALLALHMIANHFVVEGGLQNFAEIVAYLRTPIILVLELSFLVVVTWHALLGLRAVIFDFGLSATAERRVTRTLTVVGVVTVLYGFWLTYTVINAV